LRRLVAGFACRAGGSRLYGKPLQNLEPGVTILDSLVRGAKSSSEIDEVVLGIAEGVENLVFTDKARELGVGYILGGEKDVLLRLIKCGRAGAATDVFRVTSECPFTAWELLPDAWSRHVSNNNDVTVTDFLPEGVNFEIYSMAALERSHAEGNDAERSEYCSAYARRCPERFKIEVVPPPAAIRRTDLRFTVDNPEDLIICKAVYAALKTSTFQVPIEDIVSFADRNPALKALVQPFVSEEPLWAHVVK
jgi:spore coat polysaccharide biosynthesis protein SpsF